jgi:hypothetical protein
VPAVSSAEASGPVFPSMPATRNVEEYDPAQGEPRPAVPAATMIL